MARIDDAYTAAVAAIDTGDVEALGRILDAEPDLVRHRCRIGPWYEDGYFAGATLLHHVTGNPVRHPLPANVVEVARLLLRRGAAAADATATVGLVLTSRQASEAGVGVDLLDALVAGGASFDLHDPDLLDLPLLNVASGTAAALAARGAVVALRHAAGLGRRADVERLAPAADGATLAEALVFACVGDRSDTAAALVAAGARGDVLVGPGGATLRTALHEAANRGHAPLVTLLLDAGADPTVRDHRWQGTAAGWAAEGGHHDLAERLDQASKA